MSVTTVGQQYLLDFFACAGLNGAYLLIEAAKRDTGPEGITDAQRRKCEHSVL
jgi:hypothetical protein